MGFTRISSDMNIIQALDDLPNETGGLSATQLKTKFDEAGNTLKTATNGLMTELENVSSAANLGADIISDGDESDANIQAKLEKLYADMQDISQGSVADGSITSAKLATSLSDVIGFKDNTLQEGLNAEKVGGETLAQIKSFVTGGVIFGTYTGNTTGTTTTQTITLGFQPKLIFITGYYKKNQQMAADNSALAIILGTTGKIVVASSSPVNDMSVTLTETGFTLTGSDMNYSSKSYSYVAIR